MPVFQVNTNVEVTDKDGFLLDASRLVASALGKPESYVMIQLSDNQHMSFAGTSEPLAFCTLKSLGLKSSQAAELSKQLCDFLHTKLGIEVSRIYIEFAAPERAMFGWNGSTF
ncbi:MAG TPA: hypothetical protein EYP39_06795 [Ghiorsea sp.]|nr:hypothetical protein [Ghiorsea sp.]